MPHTVACRQQRQLGVSLERVDELTAAQLGVDQDRVCVVTAVVEESPASAAGLRRHDVITRIGASERASIGDVRDAVRDCKRGESIGMTVIRAGQPIELTATPRP